MTTRALRNKTLLADWLYGLTLVWACVPLAFTLKIRLLGYPILNGFYLATAIVSLVFYFRRAPGKGRFFFLFLFAGIYMGSVTILYLREPGFDVAFLLFDVTAYMGLIAGAAFATVKGALAFRDLLQSCYAGVCIVFGTSILLLLGGYIDSAGGTERQLDGAMYTSSLFLAMAFPVVWSKVRRLGFAQKAIAWMGVALCMYFAVISATRSVLIVTVASVIFTAVIETKRDRTKLVWLTVALTVALAAAVVQGLPGQNSLLAERLESTDLKSEVRLEELSYMFDQMGVPEWIHGTGLGSGFYSPITMDSDSGRTQGPHIAILTLLYKGGLPVFVVLVAFPFLLSVGRMLLSRSSEVDPFFASVAVYFVASSLSGGYSFLALFLLGSVLPLGLEIRFPRRATARLRVVEYAGSLDDKAGQIATKVLRLHAAPKGSAETL